MAEPISPMVLKGATDLTIALFKAFFARKGEGHKSAIKTNIEPHIAATLRKCSHIKTILNPHHPADFLSIHATQRFIQNKDTHDHYEMVDYIRGAANNVILTGTGGSGKSMFTRYLWLSMFVHSDGRIPLFIELRNLNSMQMNDDLSFFIRHSINLGKSSLTEDDYKSHLKNGDFVIILDGFDELVNEKSEAIQKQIIELSDNYPETKFVVTSRPDDKFAAWPSYEVIRVAPMEKEDVVELIEKAEFTDEYKVAFIKKLKTTDLFSKHRSFLSNPLLASMMLLTFSHNFDIPDRMHLFYQQAFDALYQRHDSYKPGGFKRQFKSGLPEDMMKRLLSYFCLITYYDERFSFTREEVLSVIEKAKMLSSINAQSSDILDDMCMCICFLIQDGQQYTFSHRSFQEYFCSYCLAYVSQAKFESLVIRFSRRVNDQVLSLLFDMNPDLLRRLFVLPMSERYRDALQIGVKSKSVALFMEEAEMEFMVESLSRHHSGSSDSTASPMPILLNCDSELYAYTRAIERIHNKKATPSAADRKKGEAAVEKLLSIAAKERGRLSIKGKGGHIIFKTRSEQFGNIADATEVGGWVRSNTLEKIFMDTHMATYVLNKLRIANEFISEQKKIEKTSSNAMDDIFS